MAPHRAGRDPGAAAGRAAARAGSRSTAIFARPRASHPARPDALAAPALLRLLPRQRRAGQRARRLASAPASACSACPGRPSPALTELEEVVTDWMRQMVGLSDAWSGVIQDTASTSTLVALICARERATRLRAGARRPAGARRGRWSSTPRRRATARSRRRRCWPASAATTSALVPTRRAVRACGPDALEAAIAAGPRRGPAAAARWSPRPARPRRPRSTRSRPIAEVARRHGLWLHVDAAMAGSAMILPECRWMWDGIEGADSLVLNPHKWLGRRVRLLALLRARPAAPGARDVAPTRATCRRGRRRR